MPLGQYVVRIEIGWLLAIPHNKIFKFRNEETERSAFLRAASLAVVQPLCRLWREEGNEKVDLYWGDEWVDPAYQDIYRTIRDEAKNGRPNRDT